MSSNIGYLALLRRNHNFRRLWYGQVVSQLGDWFDSIALFSLLLRLTGAGEAVGLLLVAQLLPSTVVGPWAGVLVDRLPRRLVLIATDLGRALLVLLFLFVRSPDQIWIVYVVTVLKVVLASCFEPARTAIVPQIVSRDELATANAISGATWSAMLALGAALGGLVAGTLGTDAAFVIDSASFLLSAVFIARVRVQEAHLHARKPTSGLQDVREGVAFLARHRDVLIYTLTKALWSLGGGVLLLLTLFGRQVFPLGRDGALSIGLLYAARGLGAGIGPLIIQRFVGSSPTVLRRMLGPAVLWTGLGYALAAYAPTLGVAALCVLVAHIGGSVQWYFSTTLLQLNVPNRLQGRVFAVELALLTLTNALSAYLTGVAADAGWSPRQLALILAGVFVPPGLFLLVALWRTHTPTKGDTPVAEPHVAQAEA